MLVLFETRFTSSESAILMEDERRTSCNTWIIPVVSTLAFCAKEATRDSRMYISRNYRFNSVAILNRVKLILNRKAIKTKFRLPEEIIVIIILSIIYIVTNSAAAT